MDNDINCDPIQCDLIGEWNWVSTYGTVLGISITPDKTGQTQSLAIDGEQLHFFTE